ncbi:3-oxoadipate enol-lactonase [Pseudoduganella flava]|uniref:3-oxoadipate enol-lactonase n=1 Tax=Pseudoduganella flava TaxID=871742 RepID=A0A562Q5Q3_9BURK|nr:alpha/beta fold hydrolase [Pseudoduganella flava]QGZ41536.1 alpha/beta fold hydrolase [Pseudoduganella flava]TWI51510.1 3-oxoadipate enol-lactonase [Pseudoduganella flava]
MNDTIRLGDGTSLAYRLDGAADKPVLILSNSIATDMTMWDDNVPVLARHFRVLRYDTRGHGRSGAPPGAYSLDRLGRDVLELMDRLEIRHAHFLGLSLGGFIGQWLGVRAPERVDRLILSNTAPWLDGPFEEMIAALYDGKPMTEFAQMFLANWFPARMRETDAATMARFHAMIMKTPPQGLAGAFAAVRDADLRSVLRLIDRPTLVIGGAHDTVTLPEHSEQIAAAIPGAQLAILPAVHLPNVEMARAYEERVLAFLGGSGS